MKTLSTLALAAALATGGTFAVAPVAAIAKDKPVAGPKLSPEFVKIAKPAQDALAAKNWAAAEPLVAQAEAAAKNDDEKYVAASFRFDLTKGKIYAPRESNPNAPIDETPLAGPIDTLLASPSLPAANRPQLEYVRGFLAFNGRQYPIAVKYLSAARDGGYKSSDLDIMIVKAKVEGGDVAGGMADLNTAIAKAKAAGQPVPKDYYTYAISRSIRAKDKPTTVTWLNKYAKAYPSAETWHDVLITYGLSSPSVDVLDRAQRIDLYRLLRDTKGLSDQALYEEYAQDAIDRGLPGEAEAVLKEGQASGKLAASKNASDMLRQATAAARTEGSLAPLEAKARTAADGKLAAQTADGYLSQGNNAKAVDLYKVALSKGGVNADDVNTHLGIALSRSGDKAAAAAAFAAVKPGPRANLASLWATWVAQGG